MARLVTSGFEIYVANGDGPDGNTSGFSGVSRATTGQRSGMGCLRMNTSSAQAYQLFTFSGAFDRGYWARCYIKIAFIGSSGFRLLSVQSATNQVGAFLDGSGRVYHSLAAGTLSAALNDGAWHRIEIYALPSATQANRAWALRVDGTTISSGTAQAGWDDQIPQFLILGGFLTTGTMDIYFDDVALNDSQGSFQNSWSGDGAVVCLVPTADSAIGTGWTAGGGATSSLFAAVDNAPPVGVADTGTNASQIRNATANANVNYDATMQTYTAAGVPSGATINVVDPVVATASPVATGAKLGTVGVVSNPAITNINLAAAGTSGAFWSGVAAGTFPTGWKWSHSTITHAPSVTLGTAPVMRITQVTSSTRIADVCFMGIYVDYTGSGANTYTKAGYGRESL